MKLPYCLISGYSKLKGCCKSTYGCIKKSLSKLCTRKRKYVDMDEGNKHFHPENEYSSSVESN